jgi:hypothetical protein
LFAPKALSKMKEEQPDKDDYKFNERIFHTIPDELIINKSDELKAQEITVYDLIAQYTGLEWHKHDIYINAAGEEFVRTKYGFYPAMQHNMNYLITASEKEIEELKYKVKFFKDEAEKYGEHIKSLEARNRLRKAKLAALLGPIQTENEKLKQAIKTVNGQIAAFKQVNDAVLNRINKLELEVDHSTQKNDPSSADIDWSVFDDIFKEDEPNIS